MTKVIATDLPLAALTAWATVFRHLPNYQVRVRRQPSGGSGVDS